MKGKVIIGIAMIVAVLASAVGAVSGEFFNADDCPECPQATLPSPHGSFGAFLGSYSSVFDSEPSLKVLTCLYNYDCARSHNLDSGVIKIGAYLSPDRGLGADKALSDFKQARKGSLEYCESHGRDILRGEKDGDDGEFVYIQRYKPVGWSHPSYIYEVRGHLLYREKYLIHVYAIAEYKDQRERYCEPVGDSYACKFVDPEDKSHVGGDNDAIVRFNALVGCAKSIIDKKCGEKDDEAIIKPDNTSCKDFDVDPKDFDLAYDRWMLRHEFENFLVEYSSTHTLKKGSSKFKSISWLDFFFHLGFTDDENFLTGKENDLRMKIQERAQKKNENLTPVQVFEESLKLNNNYVFEALLTSHNLLRNHTNKHRAEAKYREQLTKAESNLRNATTPQEKKNAKRNLKQIKEELMKNKNVFGALKEIRESDNVGAWYHLFGTMSAGYAYPYLGRAAVRGEPIYRWLYEKPQDNLEQCWNVWGAYIGSLIAEMSIIKDEKLVDSGLTNANPATIKAGYNGMKLKGGPQ